MPYDHSFHAGNFADAHKHVALLALLDALALKAKGYLYVDTHAAAGTAELHGAEARRSGEARGGWLQLAGAQADSPEIASWIAAVREAQADIGIGRYPGSPVLAARRLRAQDRGLAFEMRAPTARALERALIATRAGARMRVQAGDGLAGLVAAWPPQERRSLALIDPPYERPDEEAQTLATVARALERFESGVAAIWFPIKRRRELDLWLARCAARLTRPTLAAMVWLHPLDSAAGLNGSGMLVVNPPYAFSQRLDAWQEELCALLGGAAHGGHETRWLVHERS
jgi:23S rRNA (adenine2030-N6)-methyltransferase